jgi:hypothetical protein
MKKIILLIVAFLPVIATAQYTVSSTTQTLKKTTILTRYIKGFVVMNAGNRKEGEIQLKVENGDTVEVRIKYPDKSKETYARNTLQSFGLASSIKVSENEREKFQEGFVVINGQKQVGQVALVFNPGTKEYFANAVRFNNGSGETVYTPETSSIDAVGQTVRNNEDVYHPFQDGYSLIIRKGKITLAQNPYPTTMNKLLSKVADAARDYAAKEADVNKMTAEEKADYDRTKSADMNVYYDEYLVKEEGGEFQVITRDNFDKWVDQLYIGCMAFKNAEDKKRNQLKDIKYISNTVNFYNDKCQ